MAKLYFRYGVMGCGKSMNLLAVASNYEIQDKIALLFKPDTDTRWEKDRDSDVGHIISRNGTRKTCSLIHKDSDVFEMFEELWNDIMQYSYGIDCVLVDEAQFLSDIQVEQIRKITEKYDVPVICYGLKTDYQSHLFEGSKRLIELADSIEEMKTTCYKCDRKAILNIKIGGNDDVVEIGDDIYKPVCYRHYMENKR